MDVFDILQVIKEQLHDLGISGDVLEDLTISTTLEEFVEFLNICGLEDRLYINIT